MTAPVSRIAPTPSGFIHVGNALNFILTSLLTDRESGTLRLRIDDLDSGRIRPEYLDDIFESLSWLGIQCDLGPTNVADHEMNYSQSLRIPLYLGAINSLVQNGSTFNCACSQTRIS